MVSDTRCPALHDCEMEREEAGQRPQRRGSRVEHRETCSSFHPFIRPSVHLSIRLSVRSPQALSGLKSALSGLKSTFSGLKSALSSLESSPSGPLPCFLSLQFTIMQSRATGIADHILPFGDLFRPLTPQISPHRPQSGHLKPQSSPLRLEKIMIGQDGPTKVPLCSTGLCALRGLCPAYSYSDSQSCKAGQWVSLTTYCPWATCSFLGSGPEGADDLCFHT